MTYRFVRVTNYYSQYIKNYYLRNPDIDSKPYSEQYKHLISDSFEIVSSYSKNLNKIGIEAFDIISNAFILQNTWKRENNLPARITTQELIIKQLKFYRPDVVWVDDFSIITSEWKKKLLQQVPSVKLLIGHICAPFHSAIEDKFKQLDMIFTCTACFKNQLEKKGFKTFLLYHGFEKTILAGISTNNIFPATDFLFSGSLYTGSGFHKTRIEYLENILEEGIKADLYCNLESMQRIAVKRGLYTLMKGLEKVGAKKIAEKLPVIKKYKSYGDTPVRHYSQKLIANSKPPIFGHDMYKLLSKAKIVFNIHGEVAQKCAGNIRMFEATGVGTCLVTDWKENILDLFEPDKEIITYTSIDECIDKVKWLLNNPSEREKIAKAGQKKTLSAHTIEIRAKQVNEIISKELDRFAR